MFHFLYIYNGKSVLQQSPIFAIYRIPFTIMFILLTKTLDFNPTMHYREKTSRPDEKNRYLNYKFPICFVICRNMLIKLCEYVFYKFWQRVTCALISIFCFNPFWDSNPELFSDIACLRIRSGWEWWAVSGVIGRWSWFYKIVVCQKGT
jgi:hypothetical protein